MAMLQLRRSAPSGMWGELEARVPIGTPIGNNDGREPQRAPRSTATLLITVEWRRRRDTEKITKLLINHAYFGRSIRIPINLPYNRIMEMSRGGRQASSLYGVPGGKVSRVIVSTLGGGRQVLLPPPGAGAMN